VAVGFWNLDQSPKAPAVVSEENCVLTYGELASVSDSFADSLSAHGYRTLGFILCRNSLEPLAAYLGALRSGHVACLFDSDLQAELLNHLLSSYKPDWVFTPEPRAIPYYVASDSPFGFLYRPSIPPGKLPLSPQLGLLLATSGSTGSPKLVRLSLHNLQANASSIVSYLEMNESDRGITSLPMSYSYGLSVLNTHLLSGGQILMTNRSFLQREYWNFVLQHRPTAIAGVPYHYEVMLQMRMLDRDLPGLQKLTQAGGRLAPERISHTAEICVRRGWKFFVMYGQTEATARISYVPPERLRDKVGSIGIAIPQGRLSLDDQTGELLYSGPNVTLGYAENRDDLGKGDELQGQLRTGDLARCDEDGFYYIVGRLKRFLKIFGKRFSLDEIEGLLTKHGSGPAACFGSDDHVKIAIQNAADEKVVTEVLETVLKVHPSAYSVVKVDSIPRFASGKLDYQSLAKWGGA
jgi:acyl-CoA synthetase (AMP-forming)/AMP-acid ligase II